MQDMHCYCTECTCQGKGKLLFGTFSGCACDSMLLTLKVFSMISSTCFCVARAVLVSSMLIVIDTLRDASMCIMHVMCHLLCRCCIALQHLLHCLQVRSVCQKRCGGGCNMITDPM